MHHFGLDDPWIGLVQILKVLLGTLLNVDVPVGRHGNEVGNELHRMYQALLQDAADHLPDALTNDFVLAQVGFEDHAQIALRDGTGHFRVHVRRVFQIGTGDRARLVVVLVLVGLGARRRRRLQIVNILFSHAANAVAKVVLQVNEHLAT